MWAEIQVCGDLFGGRQIGLVDEWQRSFVHQMTVYRGKVKSLKVFLVLKVSNHFDESV